MSLRNKIIAEQKSRTPKQQDFEIWGSNSKLDFSRCLEILQVNEKL